MENLSNQIFEKYQQEIMKTFMALEPRQFATIAEVIYKTKEADRSIFIIGNGGSATTATHMACDFNKGTMVDSRDTKEKRFKAISLTDNAAHITALANDLSYDSIFVEQLKNLAQAGDVLLVISGSGNSSNVIKAVEYAKMHNITSIGLLGFCGGGKLASMVDLSIIIQSNQYGPVEDMHNMLSHMLTCALRTKSEKESKKGNIESNNSNTPFRI